MRKILLIAYIVISIFCVSFASEIDAEIIEKVVEDNEILEEMNEEQLEQNDELEDIENEENENQDIENVEILEEKDNNGFLQYLKIGNVNLEPEFQKDIMEYTITIEKDVTELNVVVKPESEKANVSIEGQSNIPESGGELKVLVTAETGEETEYIVHIKRKEVAQEEPAEQMDIKKVKSMKIIYKDVIYDVKTNFDDMIIDYPLSVGTSVFNEKKVPVLTNEKYNFGIAYLKTSSDDFYNGYVLKNQQILPMQRIENNGSPIYFFSMPDEYIKKSYIETEISIEKNNIKAYKNTNNDMFYLYGIDVDGKYHIYEFDENTLELTVKSLEELNNDVTNDKLSQNNIMMYITFMLSTICFIIAMVVIIIKKKSNMKKDG